jgi:hypothetical protein
MLEASLIRNLQRSGPEADDADSTNRAARKYRTRAADLEPPFVKWSDNAPGRLVDILITGSCKAHRPLRGPGPPKSGDQRLNA